MDRLDPPPAPTGGAAAKLRARLYNTPGSTGPATLAGASSSTTRALSPRASAGAAAAANQQGVVPQLSAPQQLLVPKLPLATAGAGMLTPRRPNASTASLSARTTRGGGATEAQAALPARTVLRPPETARPDVPVHAPSRSLPVSPRSVGTTRPTPKASPRASARSSPRASVGVPEPSLDDDEFYDPEAAEAVPSDTMPSLANVPQRHKESRRSMLLNAIHFESFMQRLAQDPKFDAANLRDGSFIYLRPVDHAYDLHIVTPAEALTGPHVTLSASGVTFFNGDDSEFTPIEQFDREYYLHHMIRKIPVFERFRLWKSFAVWRSNVRRKIREAASESLQSKLFVLDPALRHSLINLRRMSVDVASFRLFAVDPRNTYTLEEFVQRQSEQRDTVSRTLTRYSTQVRDLVRRTCEDALVGFLISQGFDGVKSVEQLRQAPTLHSLSATTARAGGGRGAVDRGISYTERAGMRTQCRRLAKYIRVADLFVMDTLLALALRSTSTFVVAMRTRTNATEMPTQDVLRMNRAIPLQPLLSCKAKLDLDRATSSALAPGPYFVPVPRMSVSEVRLATAASVQFEPSPTDVQAQVEQAVFDGLRVITAPVRLLDDPDFEMYVLPETEERGTEDGDRTERTDLQLMISEDLGFRASVTSIKEIISAAFVQAFDYARIFLPYVQHILEQNDTLSHMSFVSYVDLPNEHFRDLVNTTTAQVREFSHIPSTAVTGLLRIQSQDLKRQYESAPGRVLTALHELLPLIASRKNDELLHEMSDAHELLAATPFSVEEYVKLMATLQDVTNKMPVLDARLAAVKELYMLLEEEGMPITDDSRTSHFMVSQTATLLKNAVQLVDDSADERTAKFSKDLDEEIARLRQRVAQCRMRLETGMVHDPTAPPSGVIGLLKEIQITLSELRQSAQRFTEFQHVLRVEVANYEDLEDVTNDCSLKLRMWEALGNWEGSTHDWLSMPFQDLDADSVGRSVQDYFKVAMQAERGLPTSAVAHRLRSVVDDFRMLLPVVVDLRSACLKDRHWTLIHNKVGSIIHGAAELTLQQLLDMRVSDHADEIHSIASDATQESVLEDMVSKVEATWADCDFTILPHKETRDVFILTALDDIMVNLDDSLVTINTVMGSRFVGPIRAKVAETLQRLLVFQDTLDEWLQCQRTWLYLETIFSAPDIQRQLPAEAKSFAAVDAFWKEQMRRVKDDPNALKAGSRPGLLDMFRRHNSTLDQIQKSLEDYLSTKRAAFPRFYFLSNDELLQILAQTKDPFAVQPHLRKCFDALSKLHLKGAAASMDIEAMESPEGEVVSLGRNLKVRNNVEEWLTAVEDRMRTSLYRLMKNGIHEYQAMPRTEWIKQRTGQVVSTVAQIMWCRGTEAAISQGTLMAWYRTAISDLTGLTALVRSNLTSLERKVVVALVTTDVHARDIVEELATLGVKSTSAFAWQQQLRYYWDTDVDDVRVHQAAAVVKYGYEYQGCTSRLVITPLTDRCWMTLTAALHLKLGGSPAGPAGTGKTESSKDLAKALGIQCIVFNCSDQIDYIMIGKLFSGLAQAGAWSCLDEFNRIDVEVLSVVAQQLLVLRQARLAGKTHVLFEGHEMPLKEHHVIITMNPGYAGRTELPDNLKVFFRPVAMMIPDYALIAEIMLFAEGFDNAKVLSRKMTKLYKLASEQLSQQCHYDYGLRAVKSVLVMAGVLKRRYSDMDEDVVLIRAMRDSNVPKFLDHDLPLFGGILNDLFPNVAVPTVDATVLINALKHELFLAGHQPVPRFLEKIVQIRDTLDVRFGMVIVGPTGAGKTSARTMLASAMTTLAAQTFNAGYHPVHTTALNPKAISMGELYGEFNELTQEWADGLGSSIMRAAAMDESSDSRWTVFDGPIDALWIENMNTVLDDNMTLCLANGQRIKLRHQMRMIFEVEDLLHASPATVSRLGVVYMTPADLGWEPVVESWVSRVLGNLAAPAVQQRILSMFSAVVPPTLTFVRTKCTEPVPTVELNRVMSMCAVFQSLYQPSLGVVPMASDTSALKMADKIFAVAFTWGMGGTIDPDQWADFNAFARDLLDKSRLEAGLPTTGLLHDFWVDAAEGLATFRHWADLVPTFTYNPEVPFFQTVVPTADTARYTKLLATLLDNKFPVFLTGAAGTGKTSLITSLLAQPPSPTATVSILPLFLNFSARTSSAITQAAIESKLEKKRNTLLGAPVGKKVVVVVDDVNMPAVEEYGAQPPIELLRQLVDYGGFYDRSKRHWKQIADTSLIACAAPPGGGRTQLTARFMRHFVTLCMPSPNTRSMTSIFQSILTGALEPFVPEVKSLSAPIVASTVEVFLRIAAELRPTPSKFHYTFNLRDASKVFQGLLRMTPQKFHKADAVVRLWVHECTRVFHDRLVNAEDRRWFTTLMIELLVRHFRLQWKHETIFEGEPLMFGDYFKPGAEVREYVEARDLSRTSDILEAYMHEYNARGDSQLNLVFFRDAVEHVNRMCRILGTPRGHAVLIGVGGCGKQSVTRLAAFIMEQNCVQFNPTRTYGLPEFRDDLKPLVLAAGIQGQGTTLLITDAQIVEEGFLEDVSGLLNAGEVPNLFPADELDTAMTQMEAVLVAAGITSTRDECYAAFVGRVRDNLHVCLALSPVGDRLRLRCRQFPAIINCCTLDWLDEWPRAALESVAQVVFQQVENLDESYLGALVTASAHAHLSMTAMVHKYASEVRRQVYVTPKSFLDLLHLYVALLDERREDLGAKCQRMKNGYKKLEDTNVSVEQLRKGLTALQPVLEAKAKETEELLVAVAREQAEAAAVAAKVAAEEAVVKSKADLVAEVQADAQRDLDVAMPALDGAIKALDALDRRDITEMKSFPQPPPAVKIVMEAVCVLLKEKTDWETAKRLLGINGFINMLQTYDKDNIPAAVLKQLRRYIELPEMQVANVRKVSSAATSLCMWVHAIDKYSVVAKEVEPKRQRLQEMNVQLEQANAILEDKQKDLNRVMTAVRALEEKCKQTQDERDRLINEAEMTRARLKRAEKLTAGLADEGVRWKATAETMEGQIHNIVGDVFVAAATVSYCGAFSGLYRQLLHAQWTAMVRELGIPSSETNSLEDTFGDPVLIQEWQMQGLPTDSVSTTNAIIVSRTSRWPLLIDPQGQARKWVRKMEANENLEAISATNPHFGRSLEHSVRVGRPLLIEDVGEQLDPLLGPLLNKATVQTNGRLLIRIGDTDVDYDLRFRMYLATSLANPHYLPQVCIQVNLINFTVTEDGLEDQLLGLIVQAERPDVEKRKARLVKSVAADQRQLQDVESKILRMLSESSENVLDDDGLITTLANSKNMARIIGERMRESQATQAEIQAIRAQYQPGAARGSVLYFVVAQLALIDPMYQFSLDYFTSLFLMCIRNAEPSPDVNQRVNTLISAMTDIVYRNVCRGLFENHKLLFSFLICTSIQLKAKAISHIAWNWLLRGAGLQLQSNRQVNPLPRVLNGRNWDLLCLAPTQLAHFEGLIEDMIAHPSEWEAWSRSSQPHLQPLPSTWHGELDPFERLLLLKTMCEDKLMRGITEFVRLSLGDMYVVSAPVSMDEVNADMSPSTPCIFVLSQGADPTSIVLRFAEERKMDARLHVISLGQGQGPKAQQMIAAASQAGDWVLLQNCHLAKSWMPALEQIVLKNVEQKDALHADFRLFLTSFPASYFPVTVLQNGVKLTNEPPKGIRANVLRSLDMFVSDGVLDSCAKTVPWHKLLFGLVFFHSMVQERRKFGPLGWNIPYEFNDTDLETSVSVLKLFLESQADIPWEALKFVTGQINYGGRVTDDWDRRCLLSVLGQYYNMDILRDDHRFSESGTYFAPPIGNAESYKLFVEEWPRYDSPEVFGMHPNANITFQVQEVTSLLNTVLNIQPRQDAGGGSRSSDTTVMTVAGEIEASLPAPLKIEEAGRTTFVVGPTGLLDSLATVLQQEMTKFNALLRVVHNSTTSLQRAIKGLDVMSDDLDSMYSALLNNQVPKLWAKVAYPSLKSLSSWLTDLQERVAFMRRWLVYGQPTCFHLPAFFFPQGFLTGALQVFARKYQVPINALEFGFEFLAIEPSAIRTAPEDGVIVHGLWLDGARWNEATGKLDEAFPGEMFSKMPPIRLIPMVDRTRDQSCYECPVYKTSVRAGALSTTGISTNFVLAIDLPTSKPPQSWVWQGVALLLNLTE